MAFCSRASTLLGKRLFPAVMVLTTAFAATLTPALTSAPARAEKADTDKADKNGKADKKGEGDKNGEANEIDTEHIFGFLTGSDIGELGEREIEGETFGRFGKRTGRYSAVSSGLSLEYVPTKNLRLEFGGSFAYHNISGVSGLDNLRRGDFEGLSFGVRYQLLDREHAPFGLTIGIEPNWNRVDGTTGTRVDEYGAAFSLLADKELVKGKVVAAFNLEYEPEVSRERSNGWSKEATLAVSGGLTVQMKSGIFLGAELRYLRSYEGLGFNAFSGHALFLGPALYVKLSDKAWVGAAWSSQIAGRAVDEPGSLDLNNFQRHQALFKFGVNF